MAKGKTAEEQLEEKLPPLEEVSRIARQSHLRLECLRLSANHADTQDIILARAAKYLEWVTNVG